MQFNNRNNNHQKFASVKIARDSKTEGGKRQQKPLNNLSFLIQSKEMDFKQMATMT